MQMNGLMKAVRKRNETLIHKIFLKQCCGSVLNNPTKAFLSLLMLKVFYVVVLVSHLKSHCILEKLEK